MQPIELLWARIKNSAGRQYSKSTALEDEKQRLNRQFEILETEEGQDGVRVIIEHVDAVILKSSAEIEAEEETKRTETESDFATSSSDGSISGSYDEHVET